MTRILGKTTTAAVGGRQEIHGTLIRALVVEVEDQEEEEEVIQEEDEEEEVNHLGWISNTGVR